MNKDQIKGAAKEATGKAQKSLGKLTGQTGQQVKGLSKEVTGKAQRLAGDAKAALKDASRKT
jgi:uncharacterized protein YjbJ (UPF0337 family)